MFPGKGGGVSAIQYRGLSRHFTAQFATEIDPHAAMVMSHNHPNVYTLGDASTVDYSNWVTHARQLAQHFCPTKLMGIFITGGPRCQCMCDSRKRLEDERAGTSLLMAEITGAPHDHEVWSCLIEQVVYLTTREACGRTCTRTSLPGACATRV